MDGGPVVVIAVGVEQRSLNPKTGDVIQTYILRSDMDPGTAVKNGFDASICGDCPRRGVADGKHANGRDCYVHIPRGPQQVWKGYLDGQYRKSADVVEAGAGRHVRIGTYGDPAAAPLLVWNLLTLHASGWTGYTHQWRNLGPEWAAYLMASVDTEEEARIAQKRGWRTYRVKWPDEDERADEIHCPASHEMGRLTTCEKCGLCAGKSVAGKNIVIDMHGTNIRHYLRRRVREMAAYRESA